MDDVSSFLGLFKTAAALLAAAVLAVSPGAMLRADRASATSVTVTVFSWITAGAATIWVALNPSMLKMSVIYLLWLHSFAIVATMITVALVTLRALRRMLGDIKQAYAIGLEHGIDIRDSIVIPTPESLGDSAPSSSETQKAPATAGASPMTVRRGPTRPAA
jgi:hypothetical protein